MVQNFLNILNQIHFIKYLFLSKILIQIKSNSKYFFDEFILGIKLKSYLFNKYKTKKKSIKI